MFFLKKIRRKLRVYLIAIPKIQYTIGFVGLMDFIFKKKIESKTLNKVFFLTNFNQEHRNEITNMVIKNKEMNKVLNHRLANVVNLNEFKLYPSNTLGFQYQQFLKDNNIPPFSYPAKYLRKCDIYTYIILRIVSTHDIYHILLNADCSYFGEGMVASFTIAQLPQYPMPCIHIGAGFIRYSLIPGANFDEIIPLLHKGSQLGKQAKQLFCIDWNNYWDKDVASIRKELNIIL